MHGELLEGGEEGHEEVLREVLEVLVVLLVLDGREGPELVQLRHLGVVRATVVAVVGLGLLTAAKASRRAAAAAANINLDAARRLRHRLDAHEARLALLARLRVLELDLLDLLRVAEVLLARHEILEDLRRQEAQCGRGRGRASREW